MLEFYIYKKLVDLNPNDGFSKYMCLAQLSTGQEAANFYLKGIELMFIEYEKQEKEKSTASGNQTSSKAKSSKQADEEDEDDEDGQPVITKLDISTAYGSLAELYLTDLWYIKHFFFSNTL